MTGSYNANANASSFNICTMTTHEQEMRDLKDNRVLFLRILEDNNPARCHELLAQHPEYIHMRCSVNDQVSF